MTARDRRARRRRYIQAQRRWDARWRRMPDAERLRVIGQAVAATVAPPTLTVTVLEPW